MTWLQVHEAAAAWGHLAIVTGVHGLVLVGVAHAVARAGFLERRPSVWAVIWTIVAVRFVTPWGPQIAGSLADVLARLASSTAAPAALGGVLVATPREAPSTSLWWTAAFFVWLVCAAGGVILLAIAARRRWRAALLLPLAGPEVAALARTLASRLGYRARRVTLHVHPGPIVPHVLAGLRRAAVVVPASLLAQPPLLRLALAHELAHLRRRDVVARWLVALTSACWFFLPIRRWIGAPLERAQEIAADALARRALDLAGTDYARSLVEAALHSRGAAAGALALTAGASLEQRVRALCHLRSGPRTGWLGASVIAAFALLALGGATGATARIAQADCEYDASIAQALHEVHPEADVDGDGELGREEACALQEQLRRFARQGHDPAGEVAAAPPLWDRLCCDCGEPVEREHPTPTAPNACEQ